MIHLHVRLPRKEFGNDCVVNCSFKTADQHITVNMDKIMEHERQQRSNTKIQNETHMAVEVTKKATVTFTVTMDSDTALDLMAFLDPDQVYVRLLDRPNLQELLHELRRVNLEGTI